MTIQALLDRVDWRCTACGVSSKIGCGCFVNLQCGGCGAAKRVQKDPTDPEGTATVKMLCPDCAGGDFSLIDYFDKDGRQLLVNESDDASKLQEGK